MGVRGGRGCCDAQLAGLGGREQRTGWSRPSWCGGAQGRGAVRGCWPGRRCGRGPSSRPGGGARAGLLASPLAVPALPCHLPGVAAPQKRLIEGVLEPEQVDALSIVAMAGATSEAMKYDDVVGQVGAGWVGAGCWWVLVVEGWLATWVSLLGGGCWWASKDAAGGVSNAGWESGRPPRWLSLRFSRHPLTFSPTPQNADMFDLNRIMQRQQPKMNDAAQQNQTRWAVWQAGTLLRQCEFRRRVPGRLHSQEALMDARSLGPTTARRPSLLQTRPSTRPCRRPCPAVPLWQIASRPSRTPSRRRERAREHARRCCRAGPFSSDRLTFVCDTFLNRFADREWLLQALVSQARSTRGWAGLWRDQVCRQRNCSWGTRTPAILLPTAAPNG